MKRTLSIVLAMMLFMQGIVGGTVAAKPITDIGEVQVLAAGPSLTETYPETGMKNISPQSSFSMVFSEPVKADSGNITVYDATSQTAIQVIKAGDVSINGNIARFTVSELKHDKTYYITVDNNAFLNYSNQPYVGISTPSQWLFETGPATSSNPILVTDKKPLGYGVPVNTALTITFNQEVLANKGQILIKKGGQVETSIQVPSPSNVSGWGTNTLTITGLNLQHGTDYSIEITPDAIMDRSGKPFSGLNDWTFKTVSANNTPPQLQGTFPQHLAGGVVLGSELIMRMDFNEPITVGSGKIQIKRMSDNTTKDIMVPSNDVSVSGNTATIRVRGLEKNTEYYVLADSGTFYDSDMTPFAGIQNSNVWRFTTEAGSNQSPITVTSLSPANNSTGVSKKPTLKMVFNKEVYLGNGYITVYQGTNAVQQHKATSANVKGGGSNTIEIALNELEDNKTYYVQVDRGAFRDSYNNEFNGIKDSTTWTFRVSSDTSAPAISSVYPADNATNVPLNTELIMTMNKDVAIANASGIVLKRSNGSAVSVDVSVSSSDKRQVHIKPRSPLSSGTSYTVSIAQGALKDLSGNPYPGMTNAWTFKTLIPDTVAPVLESAVMAKSDMIELTYSKDLDSSSTPYLASFKVTVNDEERPLVGVTVQGKKVSIFMQSGIATGQVVKVSYTQGSIPLKDVNGNRAASFSSREVTNNVETSSNKITSVTVMGTIIQVTFNEWLKELDSRGTSQFTIMVDGVKYTPVSATAANSTLLLTLNTPVTDGQVVTVQYTPGSYPLTDRNNANISAFGPVYARNSVDTKPPVLVSTVVDGSRLVLNYNEGLHPDFVPMKSFYSVLVNDKARYVNKVDIRNNQVILTLSSAVTSKNDIVTLSYVPGIPRLMDLSGNQAPAFNMIPVGITTDTSYPQVDKASVDGNQVTLLFTKQLDHYSVPSAGSFTVRTDYAKSTVRSVQVNNSTVTLTLAQPIAFGETVYVTYSAPSSNYLQDMSGNKVRGFTSLKVTNSSIDGGGSSGTLPSNTKEASWSLFLKDMLLVDTAAAKKTTDRSLSGQYVNRYSVDDAHWKTALEYASRNGVEAVVLDLSENEKAALVAIPMRSLEEMARKDKELKIGLRYGDWLYTVALKDLDFASINRQLGTSSASATLLFQMEKQSSQQASGLSNAIRNASGSVIVEPHEFQLSAYTSYPSAKAVTLDTKTHISYRTTQSIAAEKTSAVRLDQGSSGQIAYIPTTVKDEGSVSVVNSQMPKNGALAIARSNRSFSDVGGHWAASDINALAGRFIVDARSGGKFEPNKPITRGEFAVFVSKSLGLDGNVDSAKRFRDVNPTSAAAPYIGAAVKANIITGFTDGTYKPDSLITREQMALMMNRAMIAAGKPVTLNGSVSSYISGFKDYKSINVSSQDAVAKMVQANIIQGMTGNKFGPKENATRAQASIMIRRMMQQLNYI
ncbi:Ig-like domain-containing protein [Paenibacillus marinisediminis]